MSPCFFLAQIAAPAVPVAQPTTSPTLGMTEVVIGIVVAAVAWFLGKKGIKLPSVTPTPAPSDPSLPALPIPLPDGPPKTNRPILDWMAAILVQQYGADPKVRDAILAEVEALKKVLDAANIPSPLEAVK